jgi:uncharacterized protein with PIN domain
MLEVEVKRWHGGTEARQFGWHLMPIKEALRLQDEKFRCPECLGQVKLHRGSEEKETIDHGEHCSKNPGCSLGDHFNGEKKLHLKPLS